MMAESIQVSLKATMSKHMPSLLLVNWSDPEYWYMYLTLKTFSAMPTHMVDICGKFHWNPFTFTKYRDIYFLNKN